MRKLVHSCRGQIAIILTLALPSLIAAAVLGADATTVYLDRISLRQSVEGAVLAGAGYLPSNPSLAVSAARSYATISGVKAADIVSTSVSPNKRAITMSARKEVRFGFARVLGLGPSLVSASATASIVVSPCARPAVIGVSCRSIKSNGASRRLEVAGNSAVLRGAIMAKAAAMRRVRDVPKMG